MKQLSERVEREFEKWQDEFGIPLTEEFQVKTLLQLQEEYDNTEIGSHTTRTRESLLHMIWSLKNNLALRMKTEKSMYVDVFFREGILKKVIACLDDNLYTIEGHMLETIADYASIIESIAIDNNAIVYINTKGYGSALYDELKKSKNIIVKELVINNKYSLKLR